MEKKIAFFDIDNTLIYGDSLFSLYKYGCKKWPKYCLYAPGIPFAALAYILHLIPIERMKELYYKPLKSFTGKDYSDFFEKMVWGKRIENTVNALKSLKDDGYFILMATASPYAYMRLWEKYGLADKVIGTSLFEKDGKYLPKVVKKNCAGKQKADYIKEYLNENGITFKKENAVGFSDSDRDIPMLSLCGKRIRVLKNGEHTEFIPKTGRWD